MHFLCLHGFRHNGIKLKKSMDTFIKKSKCQFTFLDAPFDYKPTEDEKLEEKGLKQWYSATKDNIFTLEKYDTLQESLDYIVKEWNKGSYDGIIGFSQGANIAQILLYKELIKPKKVILCCPFLPTDKTITSKEVDIKTCIMAGTRDTLLPTNKVLEVCKYFKDNMYIEYEGGHYFSTNSSTCTKLIAYLS